MIQYMYGFDYHSAHKPCLPTVFLHLKIYQIAVKYGVHALEKDAIQAFTATINQIGIVGNFAELVPEVYNRTATGDQELRDALVDFSYRQVKALAKMGGFADLLEHNHEYAVDLLKKFTALAWCQMMLDNNLASCCTTTYWQVHKPGQITNQAIYVNPIRLAPYAHAPLISPHESVLCPLIHQKKKKKKKFNPFSNVCIIAICEVFK